MKATLLKMSVITTLAIFLFVGISWADGEKNRLPKKVDKKHYDRHWAVYRAKRQVFQNHHYRHRVIRKHYHRYKPFHNVFSYRASLFDPGWSFTIKTRSRR
jgi:hypothetical protein